MASRTSPLSADLLRARRLAPLFLLLLCVGVAALALPPVWRASQQDYLAFSDFFAQWSFAKFVESNDPASIYDANALHQFQLTLEPHLKQTFPYPYPPSYLFVVFPLAQLPFGAAYLAWDAVSLLLFLWAVLGSAWRSPALAFVLFAPTTVIALTYGQSGLLASALIVGGLRLMRSRPGLAGLLLGLATFKPQLGVLIPLALIAAGYWRILAAASATALLLVVASGAVFGWQMWPEWLQAIGAHASYVEQSVNDYLKPTIMATFKLAGVALPVASVVQAAVAVAVAAIVCICFRRGATDLSLAALQAGTYLTLPYFFRYDLPMLASAMVLFARAREREAGRLDLFDGTTVAVGLLFPALTMLTTRFFYVNTIALLLIFSMIAYRRLAPQNRAAEIVR